MNLDELIDAVCRFPERKDGGGKLLEEYRKKAESVTAEKLEAHLRLHPNLVEAWLQYSEDQRCFPAWYVLHSDRGSVCEAGVAGETPVYEFDDRFCATAFFIKGNLDQAHSPGCCLLPFLRSKPRPSRAMMAYLSSRHGRIRNG